MRAPIISVLSYSKISSHTRSEQRAISVRKQLDALTIQHALTSRQLSSASKELDETKQLLAVQRELCSANRESLRDLGDRLGSEIISRERTEAHLAISQAALFTAAAENSALKEQLTVAQSNSSVFERERNAIWTALSSVRSTLNPDFEEFNCRADDFQSRVDSFAAQVASRLPPPWAPPVLPLLDLENDEQIVELEIANQAYAEDLRSARKAYLDSHRQNLADQLKIEQLSAEIERLQTALTRQGT